MIEAKVIADSLSPHGHRLTTMVVTFPRIILAEFNTHRVFSRNSASSRAIPFKKMAEAVENTPFTPIAFQKDHAGMQGTEYLEGIDAAKARAFWAASRRDALFHARTLNKYDVTKQLVNRRLEADMWHTVIVSATEWENFFQLRCPQYEYHNSYGFHHYKSKKEFLRGVGLPDKPENYKSFTDLDWLKLNRGQGEIHMMALAEAMYDALNESKPQSLQAGDLHLPYGDTLDWEQIKSFGEDIIMSTATKICTVKCARVSYTVVGEDGKELSYEKLIQIFDEKLMASNPKHYSPFEHIGKVMNDDQYNNNGILINGELQKGWCKNFRGFIQFRAIAETL